MPVPEVLRTHRLAAYSAFSTVLVSAVIANALKNHSNFFSVAFYLSRSSGSVMALANFAIVIGFLFGKALQHLFFGPLRMGEVERLYDRTWYFLTESLLAFTIFRDEFDVPFAVMFGTLLFFKCFHWLVAERVDWMNQVPFPGPPALFHIRMNILFLSLWLIDTALLFYLMESLIVHGMGASVLFANEYAIMLASLSNAILKYIVYVVDVHRARSRGGATAPEWEQKSMYIFYIELITDFAKLLTYITFFAVVMTFYGLPLNIIRDVFVTARSFILRVRDLMRYRTVSRHLNDLYPDATAEELDRMGDKTCIICREEMVARGGPTQPAANGETPQQAPVNSSDRPNDTPKKLPCGHVFHFHCMRSWLERQQNCPTCRRTLLEPTRTPRNRPPQLPPQGAPGDGQPQPQLQQPQPQQRGPIAGVLGRLLGAPNPAAAPPNPQPIVPPIVPGQFAHGPPPQPMAPGGGFGFGYGEVPGAPAQRPPPAFAGDHHNQQLPPQTPNAFQGFNANGAWHPWGYAPNGNGHAAPAQGVNPPEVPVQTTTPATTDPTHTRTDSTESTDSSKGESSADPSNPRDAAALAALRRMASSQSTGRPVTSNPSKESPAASSSRLTPTPTSTTPTPTTPARPAQPVPSLIPLFDPSVLSSAPRASLPAPRYIRLPQASHLSPSPSTQQPFSPFIPPNQLPPQAPLPALPPVLTDEQLGKLDRITREAIDERIRVLENVQTTVWRCMEDLVRMRSVLPETSSSPQPSTSSQPSQPSSSSSSDVGNEAIIDKGKGRETDVKPLANGVESSIDGDAERSSPMNL